MACVEFDMELIDYYFDRKTGRVIMVEKALREALEAGDDEEELETLYDGGKEMVEITREIINDIGPDPRFIDAPCQFDFHEYREMERFIGTLGDAVAVEQLTRAIRGKGAFRYFKDTVARLGLRDQWFSFRDAALKECVLRWASANDVTVDESQ